MKCFSEPKNARQEVAKIAEKYFMKSETKQNRSRIIKKEAATKKGEPMPSQGG